MIVRNNALWRRRASKCQPKMYGATCPVNYDWKCKTVRVVYWRAKRDHRRHCMISPGKY